MNNANRKGFKSAVYLISAAFLVPLSAVRSQAQRVQHLSITQPGGIPGQPTLTGVVPTTNGVTVTWDGPSGYYQLFQKKSLTDTIWKPVGARTNLSRRAFVSGANSNA